MIERYSQFSDQEILAKTAFGENSGGGEKGMQSVINVILNRVAHPRWWGDNVRDVCLMPEQFDAWNTDDPNFQRIMNVTQDDPVYDIALDLAAKALADSLPDITNGATMYFANSIEKKPYWARGHTPCAVIAGQQFYSDIC